jgi:hypothetical protein
MQSLKEIDLVLMDGGDHQRAFNRELSWLGGGWT